MIDYDKSDNDLVVAEVRRAREDLAKEHDFDLKRLFAEMQRRQATSGRKYASLSPTRPNPSKKAG